MTADKYWKITDRRHISFSIVYSAAKLLHIYFTRLSIKIRREISSWSGRMSCMNVDKSTSPFQSVTILTSKEKSFCSNSLKLRPDINSRHSKQRSASTCELQKTLFQLLCVFNLNLSETQIQFPFLWWLQRKPHKCLSWTWKKEDSNN